MWTLPFEARPAAFHHFLAWQLAPGEPIYHAAYGTSVTTFTRAKAWGSLKSLGRAIKQRGVARTLAEVAVTAAAVAVLPSALAEAEWGGDEREGWSPPELEGVMVGLTPHRLILLAIARSKSPDNLRHAYAPLWVASLGPEQLGELRVRMREKTILKNTFVVLSIGEGEAEETFWLEKAFHPDNFAQAKAIEARLSAL